jgi:transcription initiation factor IIE alpha subunit
VTSTHCLDQDSVSYKISLMMIEMTCPRCGAELTAADEDELVARVQQHVREDHELPHTLPAKHILRELRRQST